MGWNTSLWLIWAVTTTSAGVVLVAGMLYGGATRAKLLIGKTSSGHHQIELACNACHTQPFGGGEVLQNACLGCHKADLKAARDSHPIKKFTDPRNADRLQQLNAIECVTCHREHKPEITHAMGVTLPIDYCARCHGDIGKERSSHRGLAFTTCASAGCHNYHDNRALYEDFLVKHGDDPDVRLKAFVNLRAREIAKLPASKALPRDAADAPQEKLAEAAVVDDWLATTHAKAGVNCSGCHEPARKKDAPASLAEWVAHPDQKICATCHQSEAETFTQGKHGMRLAENLLVSSDGLFGIFKREPLTPMRPELARLPMQSKAHGREIGCNSCHPAHRFETARAQVGACLGCHDDRHSRAYIGSPHHKLWLAEINGVGAKGTGVSCATCHMPRRGVEDASGAYVTVANHNQNENLRPNEKMIRSVCAECHGLRFAIDALADTELAKRNYSGKPSVHIESIDWAKKRISEKEASK